MDHFLSRLIHYAGPLASTFLFLSIGCGSPTGETPSKAPETLAARGFDQALSLMEAGDIRCASDEGCPRYVGLIASSTSRFKIETCTAIVLSPNWALAPAQCLPQELRYVGSELRERTRILLPESGRTRVLVPARVAQITLQEPDQYAQNLALIALEPSDLRFQATLSRGGLLDQERLTRYSARVIPADALRAEVVSDRCRVNQRSYALPQFEDAFNALGTVSDCESPAQATDGSALINAISELKGVVLQPVKLENYEIAAMRAALGAEPNASWLVANGACMNTPAALEETRASPTLLNLALKGCKQDTSFKKRNSLRQAFRPPPVLQKAAQSLIARQQNQDETELDSTHFQWQATEREFPGGYERTYRPECFKRVSEWLGGFKRPGRRLVPRYQKDGSFMETAPLQTVRYVLQRNLSWKIASSDRKSEAFWIEFKPADLSLYRSSFTRVYAYHPSTLQKGALLWSGFMAECGK